jgi:hypothetical protein
MMGGVWAHFGEDPANKIMLTPKRGLVYLNVPGAVPTNEILVTQISISRVRPVCHCALCASVVGGRHRSCTHWDPPPPNAAVYHEAVCTPWVPSHSRALRANERKNCRHINEKHSRSCVFRIVVLPITRTKYHFVFHPASVKNGRIQFPE